MAGLKLQFTQAGLEQLLSAQDRGLKAEITHMAFGDSAYAPTKSQTALVSEKERIEVADYQGDGQNLRLAGKFEGALEYAIREIGIFLADGTLLGVYSQAGKTLGYRTPVVKILQWFTLPSDTLTVVVGTENLNLILDEEFAQLAEVQINTLHRQMLQEFRLLALEQQAS